MGRYMNLSNQGVVDHPISVKEIIDKNLRLRTTYDKHTTVLSFKSVDGAVYFLDDNRSIFLYERKPNTTVLWDLFVERAALISPQVAVKVSGGAYHFNPKRFDLTE